MNNLSIAIIGGALGMFGYGISDFLAKRAIDQIGVLKTLLYSQVIGVILLSLYLIQNPALPVFSFERLVTVIAFGILSAIGYVALYRAFEIGKIGIVSPISSSFVILAAIVSYVFFGEFFSALKTLALSLVIIGILLTAIDVKNLRNSLRQSAVSKGVPQALLVFLIFGIKEPLWDRFVEGQGWVVWVVLVKIVLALVLFVYAGVVQHQGVQIKQRLLVFWLILVALFETVASLGNSWAYNASTNTTSVIVAVTSVYPLISAFLAFALLRERLLTHQYFGVGITISGLVLLPFL